MYLLSQQILKFICWFILLYNSLFFQLKFAIVNYHSSFEFILLKNCAVSQLMYLNGYIQYLLLQFTYNLTCKLTEMLLISSCLIYKDKIWNFKILIRNTTGEKCEIWEAHRRKNYGIWREFFKKWSQIVAFLYMKNTQ